MGDVTLNHSHLIPTQYTQSSRTGSRLPYSVFSRARVDGAVFTAYSGQSVGQPRLAGGYVRNASFQSSQFSVLVICLRCEVEDKKQIKSGISYASAKFLATDTVDEKVPSAQNTELVSSKFGLDKSQHGALHSARNYVCCKFCLPTSSNFMFPNLLPTYNDVCSKTVNWIITRVSAACILPYVREHSITVDSAR